MTTGVFVLSVAWLCSTILTLLASGRPKTLFDLGFVVLCIFGGYYVLPGIIAQSGLLVGRSVELERVELLAKLGLAFVLAFTVSYLSLTKLTQRTKVSLPGRRVFRDNDWQFALGLFVGFEAAHVAMGSYYIDLSADYTVTYAQAQAIPAGISHIYAYLAILSIVAEIILLRALKKADTRLERKVIAVLIVFHLVQTLVTQSRQYLVRFLLVLLFQTRLCQRQTRVPLAVQVVGIVLVVVLLNIMAMIRGMTEGADISSTTTVDVVVPSEFISVYLNAYMLTGLRIDGSIAKPPVVPYVTDLAAVVPASLAPWTKIDLSTWFVWEYFPVYAERGGGLAFGTLAEATVYFGMVSAIFQAMALGGFLGVINGFARKRPDRLPVWFGCLFLYNAMWIYTPIRTTTFALLGGMVHGFIIPYIVCWTFMRTLPRAVPRPAPTPVRVI